MLTIKQFDISKVCQNVIKRESLSLKSINSLLFDTQSLRDLLQLRLIKCRFAQVHRHSAGNHQPN